MSLDLRVVLASSCRCVFFLRVVVGLKVGAVSFSLVLIHSRYLILSGKDVGRTLLAAECIWIR
jgi:hypothetical protein